MKNYIFEPVTKKQAILMCNDNRIKHINLTIKNCTKELKDGFSVKFVNKLLTNNNNTKISISLDRIFSEDEIEYVKNLLEKINLEKVQYVFYSDLAIHEILQERNYQNKLVYDAYTYLTNYMDVNAYLTFNENVVVSNQISVQEIENLLNNVNKPVIIHGFGKSVIFYSKRKLMKNYFKYRRFLKNPYKKSYYLQEEYRDGYYHIYENKFGTSIYEKDYYYLFSGLEKFNNVDEVMIHSADLKAKEYNAIVEAYLTNDENKLKAFKYEVGKGIMSTTSILLKDGKQNE